MKCADPLAWFRGEPRSPRSRLATEPTVTPGCAAAVAAQPQTHISLATSFRDSVPFVISKDRLRKAHDQLFQLYILFFEGANGDCHLHLVVRTQGPKGGPLSLGDHYFLPTALLQDKCP